MPTSWIASRALALLLAVHAAALCTITMLVGIVMAGGQSRISLFAPPAFCVVLLAGAVAVYFVAARLQQRGHHNGAAMLTSTYVVAPPVALACFLY